MRPRYRCEFLFPNGGRQRQLTAHSTEGIAAFRDGFWINEQLEYSNESDVRYWIPPHQILYITKLP
jgi:hypothetical protein